VGKGVHGTWDELPPADMIANMEREMGMTPTPIKMPPPDVVFCTVEKMEPEHTFAFRWIPYGIDASIDWSKEVPTLVTFTLEKVAAGTQLSIVESGFDKVPAHRRERAFKMNDNGWAGQAENLRRYLEGGSVAAH